MQVSWIEPEEIRALVERLQEARPKARALGWELHTLPDEPPGASRDRTVEVQALWSHVVDMAAQPPPEPAHQPAPPVPEPALEPLSDQPELDRIRQKLRALRSKAEVAGLLRTAPEAAPPPAPPESRDEAAPRPSAKPIEDDVFARPAEAAAAVEELPSENETKVAEEDLWKPAMEHKRPACVPTAETALSHESMGFERFPEAGSGTEQGRPASDSTAGTAFSDGEIGSDELAEASISPGRAQGPIAEPAAPPSGAPEALHVREAQELPHVVAVLPPREVAPAVPVEEIFPTDMPDVLRSPEPHESEVAAGAKLAMSDPAIAADRPASIAEPAPDAPDSAQPESPSDSPPSVPETARSTSPFKLADFVPPASRAPVSPLSAQTAPSVQPALSGEPARDEAPKSDRTQEPSAEIALAPAPIPEPPAVAPPPAEPSLPAVVLPAEASAPPRMIIGVPPPLPLNPELSFDIPLGNMPERLQAFAGWAMRRTRTTEFLIVDAHGDVLWGRHMHAGLVVSTMLACTAALRSSAIGAAELLGVIEQPLPAEKILSVIPCQTCYGVINIAVVRREGVEEPEAALLRRALVAAIEARPPGEDAGQSGGAID